MREWKDLSEKEQLECEYCELYKDVYGVKARWYHADTVEQARADLASLQKQAEEVWAQEKANQAIMVARFEKRVQEVIEHGAGDRKTALRWIHQAEDTDHDDEYLCYKLGLPYGYFKSVSA